VKIHPTSIVQNGAELGLGVEIGPFSNIGSQVKLGDNVKVHSHAVITGKTFIDKNSSIWPFATIGTEPQDLKYCGENTELICGSDNIFREYSNISLGTVGGGGITKIGSNNLFMVNSHIAHDCFVGDHCIFANGVSLAGHIEIQDHVILGGHSACHQFIKVGSYSMIAGGAMVSQDVPPFVLVHGNHAKPKGIHQIGLARNKFSKNQIADIKQMYKFLYRMNLPLSCAVKMIEENTPDSSMKSLLLNFLSGCSRGICR
tara:strand:+ start:1415 stop:2188 length:774 start_codon:yes stop_codon:yes gene_type:complete